MNFVGFVGFYLIMFILEGDVFWF